MGKKDRKGMTSFTHPGACSPETHAGYPGEPRMTGMPQPELMEAAIREQDLLSAGAHEALTASRHPRKLVPQTVQEQIDFLRSELGRTKRRVRELEATAKEHAHAELEAPPLRHGMYIDAKGRYWMHRPNGWHYCFIVGRAGTGPGGIRLSPDYPVQRLAEPKE